MSLAVVLGTGKTVDLHEGTQFVLECDEPEPLGLLPSTLVGHLADVMALEMSALEDLISSALAADLYVAPATRLPKLTFHSSVPKKPWRTIWHPDGYSTRHA